MFSTLPKTNFNFSVTFFLLLFENAFILDRSEFLLFGKELKMVGDDVAGTQNIVGTS